MPSTRFKVRVIPRASKDEIAGIRGDAIAIRINAPPEKGKANKALRKFVAEKLGVRTGDVRITAGKTSRTKLLAVKGMSKRDVRSKLDVG